MTKNKAFIDSVKRERHYLQFINPLLDPTQNMQILFMINPFKGKLEMVPYRAALIITFIETSRDHLYEELVLEYLADRRWSRNLLFYR